MTKIDEQRLCKECDHKLARKSSIHQDEILQHESLLQVIDKCTLYIVHPLFQLIHQQHCNYLVIRRNFSHSATITSLHLYVAVAKVKGWTKTPCTE